MINYINMLPMPARRVALALFCIASMGLYAYQDFRLIQGARLQLAAAAWPAAEGKMINAAVGTQKFTDWRLHRTLSRSTTTHILQVKYRFKVDGREYIGRGWRPHTEFQLTDRRVRDQAKAWQSGHPVTVHYNPQNPEESYIHAGIHAIDLLAWMAILPIHIIWLYCCYRLWVHFRLTEAEATLECRFDNQGPALHVTAGSMDPVSYGLIAAAVASFIVWLSLDFFAPFDASRNLFFGGFALIPVIAFIAWAAKRQLSIFGNSDLILDPRAALITLPATRWGQTPLTLSYSEIRGLILDQTKPRFQFNNEHFIIRPIVIHQDPGGRLIERPLWRWASIAPASHFTQWLMEQLNLESWEARGWNPNTPEPEDK